MKIEIKLTDIFDYIAPDCTEDHTNWGYTPRMKVEYACLDLAADVPAIFIELYCGEYLTKRGPDKCHARKFFKFTGTECVS